MLLPTHISYRSYILNSNRQILLHRNHIFGYKRWITTNDGAWKTYRNQERIDGKLKSIAEYYSDVEVTLQQGEDHRRPWSKAQLRFRGHTPTKPRAS